VGWKGKNGNLIGKGEVGPTETPGKGEWEINERNLGGWSSNRRIGELGFGRKMEDEDGDGLRCSVNGGKREWNTLFTRETTRFALCFIGLSLAQINVATKRIGSNFLFLFFSIINVQMQRLISRVSRSALDGKSFLIREELYLPCSPLQS